MPHRDIASGKTRRFAIFQKQFAAPTEFEKLRFYAEDSKFTMRNVALAGKMAAILYLLFAILDYLVYPDYLFQFLVLRVICSATVLVIAHVSGKKWARRRYRLFATLVPLTAAFFIAIMVYLVEDPSTTYYAGLNLCIVGSGTLFQWTSREAMITSLLIFGMYLVSVIPHLQGVPFSEGLSLIAGNCFFIFSTAVLVVVAAYNHNNFRYGAFIAGMRLRRNQADLENQYQQLQETLKTLRETERQLYQSEKMSFIGQLSAGVIHEIANPLNFANHALFILNKRVSSGNNDVGEVVADIQEGLDRMKGIVSDLREFSHTGTQKGENLEVNEVIQSALRILNKPIEESQTTVELEMDERLEVIGVKNQIIQVFTNLILNAVQAMSEVKDSRILRITATPVENDFVSISVSDNGSGIADEDKNRLFDPFFTTKDPGIGTGLGLSICYRIIEAHRGKIEVKSEAGSGTIFSVLLPSTQKPVTPGNDHS
ncbi:MAG: ATP-binding protein [Verrucomicrobiales bacterium]|nr:ATP-binding protein [Verrucomicrobiales bacterium]